MAKIYPCPKVVQRCALEVEASPFLNTMKRVPNMLPENAMLALERDCFKTVVTTKDGILGAAAAKVPNTILVFIRKNGGLDVVFF